ncbi:copper resistance system multicopper oxidase, partial [Gammaproteobacteria bacterium]|nr:copper resistance system multicopper oxidase [Gammaproteobacteria bacterium]
MYRRQFIKKSLAVSVAGLASQTCLPAWAQSGQRNDLYSNTVLAGQDFALTISQVERELAGTQATQVVINNQLPAPLLRWQEGDDISLKVTNHLSVDSSLHWHGILLPFQMDGVPGVSYPGIAPGDSYDYQFPIKQAGTYWYHSHSGLQEQQGLYGPIIIDPIEADPVSYDREYVLVLSDWSYEDPHYIFSRLKKMSDSYNFQRRTMGDFFNDVREQGLGAAIEDRAMWGAMRMNPTDLSDVTAAAYTFLVNGHSALENWTALFQPGEKIRLRFINASAMTIFNVRIPGLPVTVVQADGLNVKPVETDEFQIGVAETFDVIVTPSDENAYTIYCETNDRSGYTKATLAPREGMRAAVPPLRKRPLLSMKDMGMSTASLDGMSMPMEAGPVEMMPAGDQMNMEAKPASSPVMDHS